MVLSLKSTGFWGLLDDTDSKKNGSQDESAAYEAVSNGGCRDWKTPPLFCKDINY